jgi:hypothetical protein
MFRTSNKGNDYARATLKFDKKIDCMLFADVCEGAKGVVKEGDLVKIKVNKMESGLKVESIHVINNDRKLYEFYKKEERVKPSPQQDNEAAS